MSTSVPERKTNPESIPAVPPATMDASFFARLRVLDDQMFFRAAATSAFRGQLQEVDAALSTFRGDRYEPLLWDGEKNSLALPVHPMGQKAASNNWEKHVWVGSFWDIVGLALVSPERPWTELLSDSDRVFASNLEKAEFTPERLMDNRALLDKAIELCRVQTERRLGAPGTSPEYGWCVTTDPDGLSATYGSRPWAVLLESLSSARCPWSDLKTVLDAIPESVISHNTNDYLAAIKRLVKNGDVPIALQIIKKVPSLLKDMSVMDGWAPLMTDRQDQSETILYHLPSFFSGNAYSPRMDSCVDAALELMDMAFKESSQPSSMYMMALTQLLPSMGESLIDAVPDVSADPQGSMSVKDEKVAAKRKFIDGLMDRIDASLGSSPLDAWPSSVKARPVDQYHFGRHCVMTRLLDVALELRDAKIVSKLRDHWALDPQQVNLNKVINRASSKDTVSGGFNNAVLSILKTAQHIGIDLNQPITGREPSSHWGKSPDKPTLILHSVGKATKGKNGQLELLQGMVALGVDPTATNKSGWKARVYLDEDDRTEWDQTIHQWSIRQRAADAIKEVMTGVPAPKRRRVKAPV